MDNKTDVVIRFSLYVDKDGYIKNWKGLDEIITPALVDICHKNNIDYEERKNGEEISSFNKRIKQRIAREMKFKTPISKELKRACIETLDYRL